MTQSLIGDDASRTTDTLSSGARPSLTRNTFGAVSDVVRVDAVVAEHGAIEQRHAIRCPDARERSP